MLRKTLIGLGAALLIALTVFGVLYSRQTREDDRDSTELRRPTSVGSPGTTPPATSGPAAPGPVTPDQAPVAPAQDRVVWDGPDEAVATWTSSSCARQVLAFGAQQYVPGGTVDAVPDEVTFLGYRSGSTELWGDRGAPTILYTTNDKGATFQEWVASDQTC